MNTSEFYKWWDSNADVRHLKTRSKDAVERIAAEAFLAGMRAAAELAARESQAQEVDA